MDFLNETPEYEIFLAGEKILSTADEEPRIAFLQGGVACRLAQKKGSFGIFLTAGEWLGVEQIDKGHGLELSWVAKTECQVIFRPLSILHEGWTAEHYSILKSVVRQQTQTTQQTLLGQQSREEQMDWTLEERIKWLDRGEMIANKRFVDLPREETAKETGVDAPYISRYITKLCKEGKAVRYQSGIVLLNQ